MTKDEFQRKYHDYATTDKNSALLEAEKVNAELTEGSVEAIELGNKYCLMLKNAADLVREIGLI